MIWHCPPDTGFESSLGGLKPSTPPLFHRGSPRYLVFTSEQGRNICFFETWLPERSSNPQSSTPQAGSFNHCTRAPAHRFSKLSRSNLDFDSVRWNLIKSQDKWNCFISFPLPVWPWWQKYLVPATNESIGIWRFYLDFDSVRWNLIESQDKWNCFISFPLPVWPWWRKYLVPVTKESIGIWRFYLDFDSVRWNLIESQDKWNCFISYPLPVWPWWRKYLVPATKQSSLCDSFLQQSSFSIKLR